MSARFIYNDLCLPSKKDSNIQAAPKAGATFEQYFRLLEVIRGGFLLLFVAFLLRIDDHQTQDAPPAEDSSLPVDETLTTMTTIKPVKFYRQLFTPHSI